MDPKAALNAAAKNMAAYVKKYGGYENALRAYNAGPGAIERVKGYAETNKYVSTILGGETPSTKGVGNGTGGGGDRGTSPLPPPPRPRRSRSARSSTRRASRRRSAGHCWPS